jgi:hypothetical protein
MAVKNGAILHSIEGGDRIPRSIVGYELDEKSADKNTVLPGFLPQLIKSNKRYITIKGYGDVTTLGQVVSTSNIDITRKYLLDSPEGVGVRIKWHGNENFHQAQSKQADRVVKVLTGVGTVGIGYEVKINNPTQNKPARRWPRDWHGENMN